ncbi:hypothetical protein KO561_01075 [Radiobacillus kanasensis]|nr:hypothetical protein [Radiobacillus kanasensis]UFT99600.1 hypothetical protein KO561_01075 [Radiobacillus kanasensis]
MVEAFLDYALGPHGRFLSEFYTNNQNFINATVIVIALGSFLIKKRRTT